MKDVDELKQRLVEVWSGLRQTVVDDAIDEWRRRLRACVRVKHGSYYSAEYIFPDFPEQNELFSLTNLFM